VSHEATPRVAVADVPEPGVNIAGFFEGELGLGEVARKLGRGLEHAGVPFTAIPYRRLASRQSHRVDLELAAEAPYDTNIVCLNADYLETFLGDVGVEFFARRYSIGVWFWETNVFPSGVTGERFLDEIWVASEYVRHAISKQVRLPVRVVPLPIERPAPSQVSRSDLGLPDGFTFLFTFDFISALRKNATAVVEAFTRAFEPGEGASLVLKSINGRELKPGQLRELEEAVSGREDIQVRDGYVDLAEKNAISAHCDCYVSLHRSEGFGLTMAEAMALGKPVIATGYSGNMDFMGERCAYLVPYDLVPVPSDWWAHAPGAEWAEPDVAAASELMRHVFEHRDEARAVGARGREQLLRQFSLERTAQFISARLADRASSPSPARVPILRASRTLATGVGGPLADDPARGPLSFVRRLVVRTLWPHVADEHRFDSAVLDALSDFERSSTQPPSPARDPGGSASGSG
jgi:glycosyltransferase involved in cell wall biosynthesis